MKIELLCGPTAPSTCNLSRRRTTGGLILQARLRDGGDVTGKSACCESILRLREGGITGATRDVGRGDGGDVSSDEAAWSEDCGDPLATEEADGGEGEDVAVCMCGREESGISYYFINLIYRRVFPSLVSNCYVLSHTTREAPP